MTNERLVRNAARPELSTAQRRVLEWLAAYPGVEIGWEPGEYAHWTMAWASEEARQHMVGVVADLGGDARGSKARGFPRGATPRCTSQTFAALARRGLVKRTSHRPAHGVWGSATYWQISLQGAQALNPTLVLVRGDLGLPQGQRTR